jgi:hypothetical protein
MERKNLEGQAGILRPLAFLFELCEVRWEGLDGKRNLYDRIVKASSGKLES